MRRGDKYLLISISSVERKYMMGAYLKQRGEMDGECLCVCFVFVLFCFVSFRSVSRDRPSKKVKVVKGMLRQVKARVYIYTVRAIS